MRFDDFSLSNSSVPFRDWFERMFNITNCLGVGFVSFMLLNRLKMRRICQLDETHKAGQFELYPVQYGRTDKEAFDGKLEFDVKIIAYKGDDVLVEKTIHQAINCLKSNNIPTSGKDCDFCKYREAALEYEN